jgi:hypothetical protein
MRMDILSRLKLGEVADVDGDDKFSAGGWIMLRAKPGGGVKSGTGNGALIARMGDDTRHGGAGWEIYAENAVISVSLIANAADNLDSAAANAADKAAKIAAAAAVATPGGLRTSSTVKHGLQLVAKDPIPRDEWVHVFFTYDGQRKTSSLRLFVNGKPVEADMKLRNLAPKDSIRTDAATHLGRRDDFQPMRETRFQDMRFYRRMLSAEEVGRLPYEDIAAEIFSRQPDPAKWTTDEKFVAAEQYFLGQVDQETIQLASAVAAHDTAFEALTKDGEPSLIALEKSTPAYSDTLKRGDYYARADRVGPLTPHFLPAAGRSASESPGPR